MYLYLSLYILVFVIKSSLSEVIVHHEDGSESTFEDKKPSFGPGLPDSGIKGKLVYLQPVNNSCTNYSPATPPATNNSEDLIALMERKGCAFVNMVLAAQNMSYKAVIVHNNVTRGDSLVRMVGTNRTNTRTVSIPSVFVGYNSGLFLSLYDVRQNPKVYVEIEGDATEEDKEHTSFFWVLLLTSPLTFFAVLICFCFKAHCKDLYDRTCLVNRRPRNRNTRLERNRIDTVQPSSTCCMGKKKSYKPTIRAEPFKKDHRYDTCPICLEDFAENDKLWILPCEHEYHIHCIKPWLTEQQNSCPMCKRMSISLSILNE